MKQRSDAANIDFREVNDLPYLAHVVIEKDTLMKLSLKYGVSIPSIKRANQLMTDEIFQYKELLIPIIPKMNIAFDLEHMDAQLAAKRAAAVEVERRI